MAHFCGFTKLIFLLLMLARTPLSDTRPFRGETGSSSDLIAGNEFLKLFLERDELQRDLYSSEYVGSRGGGGGGGGGSVTSASGTERGSGDSSDLVVADSAPAESVPVENVKRSANSRSLREKGSKGHQALTSSHEEDGKQVVKLVTTGSKIVFLEDYDENDAILDAEVREIDLKKEKPTLRKNISRTTNLDDFKVLAVSVSSSSQRASSSTNNRRKHERPQLTTSAALATRTLTSTTTEAPSKVDLTSGDNFINRSHKSELSIDEVEPFTSKHKTRRPIRPQVSAKNKNTSGRPHTIDSENSASTNVQNVLAIPLQAASSLRSNQYHNDGQHNATTISNHETNSSKSSAHAGVDDQLLPFQTVIYHDNKEGHGPQSRSISYSSISQNIQDLQKWQHTGILAEARRNVSESLKPLTHIHQPEPAKFYSQPSQMYSVPAKFYSEPAKIYSEPSKMYGEPEKFYSEPAKVYGEPSKFYSEPSKVYSQPAKVYSEPAKTYWPPTPTDSSTTTTLATPAANSLFATSTTPRNGLFTSSRRPAIVSRIAFGEAQNALTSSTASTLTAMTTTAIGSLSTSTAKSFGTYHQRNFGHRHFSSSGNNANSSPTSTQRRIPLFNLDKLPYDVLNAPKPSTTQQQEHEQLLANNYQQKQQQQQQQQQQSRSHINPCLESAVSTLFSTSSLSAHVPIQQQQQHSSLSDQHSNQNAKGLPNGDLVKCVAEISHTTLVTTEATLPHHFTTERTPHNEDLYAATPEQNYEIEESVSVMTNGRAHGVQRDGSVIGVGTGTNDDGSRGSATATIAPTTRHSFKPMRQRVRFGTNIRDDDDEAEVRGAGMPTLTTATGRRGHLSQSYDANANAKTNAAHSNASPSYKHNADDGRANDETDNTELVESYDDYSDVVDEGDVGVGGGSDVLKTNNRHNSYNNNNNNNYRGGLNAGSQAEQNENDDAKVAYVVEGRNYRKYRVEEKTDDGFIVGEYGVVDHNDGNLRGVRYTADSTINRSLIQKALLTFLKLK
ncbi:uncharacterized protein ACN427_006339 isoform 1-T7 [Glossina fuscipes fuscipes]